MEDPIAVLFIDKGQPIGPLDKVVNEFSKFLGTIAHDYTWAPLIYTNWSKVPNKDEMWDMFILFEILGGFSKGASNEFTIISMTTMMLDGKITRPEYLILILRFLLQYWNDSTVQVLNYYRCTIFFNACYINISHEIPISLQQISAKNVESHEQ
ncbi:hypothetical protein Cgig2_032394 [Carnegiea gigantea]|uniref:Uncharacterized protein n=1 Tax=Carnegiea gigantea TaxID=171969 RepID=A0A9Q1JJL7_9CARY|nr:hypothetical protein Cgig2_032394 [Carnegiea gigantea]